MAPRQAVLPAFGLANRRNPVRNFNPQIRLRREPWDFGGPRSELALRASVWPPIAQMRNFADFSQHFGRLYVDTYGNAVRPGTRGRERNRPWLFGAKYRRRREPSVGISRSEEETMITTQAKAKKKIGGLSARELTKRVLSIRGGWTRQECRQRAKLAACKLRDLSLLLGLRGDGRRGTMPAR